MMHGRWAGTSKGAADHGGQTKPNNQRFHARFFSMVRFTWEVLTKLRCYSIKVLLFHRRCDCLMRVLLCRSVAHWLIGGQVMGSILGRSRKIYSIFSMIMSTSIAADKIWVDIKFRSSPVSVWQFLFIYCSDGSKFETLSWNSDKICFLSSWHDCILYINHIRFDTKLCAQICLNTIDFDNLLLFLRSIIIFLLKNYNFFCVVTGVVLRQFYHSAIIVSIYFKSLKMCKKMSKNQKK